MNKAFKNSDIVEARNYQFEFYKDGEPTGYYMRGEVKDVLTTVCMVKSFHNGCVFEISKDILVKIK